MRLQRVLMDQMLDVGVKSKPLSSAMPEPTTTFQMPDAPESVASLRPTVESASTPVVPAALLTPVIEPDPVEPIVAARLLDPEGSRPLDDETASAPVLEGPEVASPAPSAVDASVPEVCPRRAPPVRVVAELRDTSRLTRLDRSGA
jgi:hypothetical protein